jgi:hypothetical protein
MRPTAAALRGVLLVIAASLVSGCVGGRVNWLTDHRYSAKPRDASVDVYIGQAPVAFEKIAIIQTPASDKKDKETRERQLADIRHLARKIGADGVQDVRWLSLEGRGWVWDPYTPFPSAKQGRYQQFFLRGEAIKYVETPTGSAPALFPSLIMTETED